MQRIVDAYGAYLSVPTGFSGSTHDARVLRSSNFFPPVEEKKILIMPCIDAESHANSAPHIRPDLAYPLKSWLMRPFQDNGALTAARHYFNKELSKGRIVAEHGFGQTKARWRWLDKRIDEGTMKIPLSAGNRLCKSRTLTLIKKKKKKKKQSPCLCWKTIYAHNAKMLNAKNFLLGHARGIRAERLSKPLLKQRHYEKSQQCRVKGWRFGMPALKKPFRKEIHDWI